MGGLFDCSSACAAPAAPDYSGIAQANAESAQLGYQAATDRLNFDKQVYADKKPFIDALDANAEKIAQQQIDMADTNQKSADLQLQQFREQGIPAENRMYADAESYGNAADQETQAGIASNQVQAQAAEQRAASLMKLNDLGIRPDSGARIGMDTAMDVSTAANAANAANAARTTARDKGIALRAGAANFAIGQSNSAATGFGTSIAAGNSSTGQLSAATTAGLPAAGLVDAGYAGLVGANNQNAANQIALGGLMNQGYGISMQGYASQMAASAQENAGFGSMIGGLASAGATLY